MVTSTTEQALRLPAPVKVNLFLHINSRRADGYHELETLFQLLNWGDSLEFHSGDQISLKQFSAAGQIALDCPEQSNLAYRAAKLLAEKTGCQQGIKITLNKKSPVGAGLGGGSSDAATTLLALNKIWQLGLSVNQLAEIGLELGADVPVFVEGHTALASGVGEKLVPVNLPEDWFLVVTPNVHISTASVFSQPHLTRNTPSLLEQQQRLSAPDASPLLTRDMSPSKMCALAVQGGQNDCQTVVEMLHPEVANIRKTLEKFAPIRMSGTGSSLFAQFKAKQEARQVLANLTEEMLHNSTYFIAKGVNRSPVHNLLAD